MMVNMNTNQDKLFSTLKELFLFIEPKPDDGNNSNNSNNEKGKGPKEVMVNPQLKPDRLQVLVDSTRSNIVKLYLNCEADFLKGTQIFESIVSTQLAKTDANIVLELDKITQDYELGLEV